MSLYEEALTELNEILKVLNSAQIDWKKMGEQTELSFTREEFNQLMKYKYLIKDIDADFFFKLVSKLYNKIDERNAIIETLTKKIKGDD